EEAVPPELYPGSTRPHGEPCSGIAGSSREAAAVSTDVSDPPVYYGDPEADPAMTELFGGFPADFYAAYDAVLPRAPGYATRKHLYNLYHLLNHLNLFGSGYLAQVQTTLGLLRIALE